MSTLTDEEQAEFAANPFAAVAAAVKILSAQNSTLTDRLSALEDEVDRLKRELGR